MTPRSARRLTQPRAERGHSARARPQQQPHGTRIGHVRVHGARGMRMRRRQHHRADLRQIEPLGNSRRNTPPPSRCPRPVTISTQRTRSAWAERRNPRNAANACCAVMPCRSSLRALSSWPRSEALPPWRYRRPADGRRCRGAWLTRTARLRGGSSATRRTGGIWTAASGDGSGRAWRAPRRPRRGMIRRANEPIPPRRVGQRTRARSHAGLTGSSPRAAVPRDTPATAGRAPSPARADSPSVNAGVVAIVEHQPHGVMADRLDRADADLPLAAENGFLGRGRGPGPRRRGFRRADIRPAAQTLSVVERDVQHPGRAIQPDFGRRPASILPACGLRRSA